ncbi:MAG: hypothetical protein IKU24_00095 [Clostridia bacterium]|nr:hypothetical protein [Clostridia bacterium]
MTLDEYIARYRLLQYSAEKDERCLALYSSGAYHSFLHRFENAKDPILSSVMISEQKLRRNYEKKQRLCERHAIRLTRAISLIENKELREYALCRFLYGLTHEEIAEQSFFCVRTVYRYGKKAKEELRKAMLRVQPKRIRIQGAYFRVKGTLPRREMNLDRLSRRVASCTALHRSEAYRGRVLFLGA